jgi:D-amino peptidase
LKVLISVDMEGISGIVRSEQASPGRPDYEWARTMMAGDANAAIQGAIDGGATEIVVADSHDGMCNLRLNELHPAASLVSGSGRPLSMAHGVDESFAAMFMVGYHATCGAPEGIMNHAYISRGLQRVLLNGREVGEIGIFAGVAGCFGVSVVLVTGDDACGEEARDWLPGVETVSVKKGINRFAAHCLSQQQAHRRIREAAAKALKAETLANVKPFPIAASTTFSIEFTGSQCADAAARVPGTVREGNRTVSFASNDYLTAFQALRLMFDLGGRAVDADY